MAAEAGENMENKGKLTPIDPFTRGDWQQNRRNKEKIEENMGVEDSTNQIEGQIQHRALTSGLE